MTAFGITKVLKEFPPLIVWETARELTIREGVTRLPTTTEPDEIWSAFTDEVWMDPELMKPVAEFIWRKFATCIEEVRIEDVCKLCNTKVLDSVRVFAAILLTVIFPLGFKIWAELKITWLTVGAEMVLVITRVPTVAVLAVCMSPVLK